MTLNYKENSIELKVNGIVYRDIPFTKESKEAVIHHLYELGEKIKQCLVTVRNNPHTSKEVGEFFVPCL